MTTATSTRKWMMGPAAGALCARAAALGLVTFLMACDPPTTPRPATVTLTGTVLQQSADGLVPAAGVSVAETSQGRSGVTDRSGRYKISGLTTGLVHIRIQFSIFERIERDIPIVSDAVADFQLVSPIPLVTLAGRITEMTAHGPAPLSGVDVELAFCAPRPGGYQFVGSSTDADGVYRIRGVCEGRVAVFVIKPGYTSAPANEPDCESEDAECHWVTIKGDTRFDLVLIRKQ